jgi:hypothetical protein
MEAPVMSHPRPTAVPLLILALALMMSSCRTLPVSPREPQGISLPEFPSGDPAVAPQLLDPPSRVPVITSLRAEVRGDSLYLRALLRSSAGWPAASYDPSHAGGWVLQLFMNTDQADTGYPWMGIDYLVRGGEWLSDGSFVVRRVDLGFGGPGGWGPQSGVARFTPGARSLVLAVPLAAIGGDDGRLDFVLETYATVACPECEGGVSHRLVADYFGSTAVGWNGGLLAGAAPGAAAMRPRGLARLTGRATSSDTDAPWSRGR